MTGTGCQAAEHQRRTVRAEQRAVGRGILAAKKETRERMKHNAAERILYCTVQSVPSLLSFLVV